MSLTRRLLKELELTDDAIERIIAAHTETVDALKTEATGHRSEAERLRTELDAYRLQVQTDRLHAAREQTLCALLRRAGANEQAIPLLSRAFTTAESDWEGEHLLDENAVLAPVQAQYAAFFTRQQPLPTDRITPPLDSSILSFEDVKRMSAEEINRNWSQVCSALNPHS